MTEQQMRYQASRDAGNGHYKSLRLLAEQSGLDPDTIGRCLDRAREADAIDARRARRRTRKPRVTA